MTIRQQDITPIGSFSRIAISYFGQFLFPLVFALLTGFFVVGATAQQGKSAPENEIGGSRILKVELSSSSNQPFRVRYGGQIMVSEKACLFSLLDNEEVLKDVELIPSQQEKVKKELSLLKKLNSDLLLKIDNVPNEGGKDLSIWIQSRAADFDGKFDDILLPNQVKYLEEIKANYLACIFGYYKVFQQLQERSVIDISSESLVSIRKAEEGLRSELRERCDGFVTRHSKKCFDVLTAEQKAIAGFVLKDCHVVYPELLAGHAELVTRGIKDFPHGKYKAWGTNASWLLGYDCKFVLSINSQNGFESDFLVTSLKHDKTFAGKLEIVNYQAREVDTLHADLLDYNKRFGQLYLKNKSEANRLLNVKSEHLSKRLDEILLPAQKVWLEEQCLIIDANRTGIYWQLTCGSLSKRLKISKKQIEELEKLAKAVVEDYDAFSSETLDWYYSQIVAKIADPQDRENVKQMLSEKSRLANAPVGLLAYASDSFRN